MGSKRYRDTRYEPDIRGFPQAGFDFEYSALRSRSFFFYRFFFAETWESASRMFGFGTFSAVRARVWQHDQLAALTDGAYLKTCMQGGITHAGHAK
jgi:hypothetical protein